MNSKLRLSRLAACTILIAAASQATAVPIMYLYEGTGSGTLNGTSFFDASFAITALADTTGVALWPGGGNVVQNTHSSAGINITGLGAFTILTPSHTWGANRVLDFNYVGLGANLDINWVTVNESPLFDYQLASPIGPIFEAVPQDVSQFHDVSTSGGLLHFGAINEITFTAIIVPEPTTFALEVVAVAGAARGARLVRRRLLHRSR